VAGCAHADPYRPLAGRGEAELVIECGYTPDGCRRHTKMFGDLQHGFTGKIAFSRLYFLKDIDQVAGMAVGAVQY